MGACRTRPVPGNEVTSCKAKEPATSSSLTESPTMLTTASDPSSVLSLLHDDILVSVLSFVADVPFEMVDKTRKPTDGFSTFTNVLPFVSKRFHKLCFEHDLFWENAMFRLVKQNSEVWGDGVKRVIFESRCGSVREAIRANRRSKRTKIGSSNNAQEDIISSENPKSNTSVTSLASEEINLKEACQALETHPPHNHTASSSGVYQCLYQTILQRHVRYQGPVFYMPTAVCLGRQYGLHFFEPRYRLLISEVMSSYPISARRGHSIEPTVPGFSSVLSNNPAIKTLLAENQDLLNKYHAPTFIHAHEQLRRNSRNTPAVIVQVKQCAIFPDGEADVLLLPVAYIWIDQLWERPGTGGLMEARGVRMGKDASDSYEMWRVMSGYGNGDGRGRSNQLPIP